MLSTERNELKMWKIQKGYHTVSRTFRLPEKLMEDLGQLAYDNNISANQLVVQCLKFALDNLDNDENI